MQTRSTNTRRVASACIALAISLSATLPAIADCSDPASPNVDWYGCDLRGRDFSFADLSNAMLILADLTGANVTGTNFGARTSAEGRILCVYSSSLECDETSARLGEAIWVDGRTCAAGSHGYCE